MHIAIGCDHAGLELKQTLLRALADTSHEFTDFGVHSPEPADYPDVSREVAEAVAAGDYDRGILICGTGVGTSIAANKVHGVRAALVADLFTAKATRQHNDSNVLALGARVTGPGLAEEIARVWLTTPFSGEERHSRRIRKITAMEQAGFDRECTSANGS